MKPKSQTEVTDNKIVMEYKPPFKVEIMYFKQSGKYYTDGSYQTDKLHMFEIFEEVEELFRHKRRPGLVHGENEFYAVVSVPNHPHDHPALILPTVKK